MGDEDGMCKWMTRTGPYLNGRCGAVGKGACWVICTRDVSSCFSLPSASRSGKFVRVGPMCGLSPTSSGPGVCTVQRSLKVKGW